MNAMRKSFERWLKPLIGGYFDPCDHGFEKDAEGHYVKHATHVLWMAYAAGYDDAP